MSARGDFMRARGDLCSPYGIYARHAAWSGIQSLTSCDYFLSKVSCTLFTIKGVLVFFACVIIFGLKTL
jgi:hypothetical protein